ncbi:hypothetical protein RIF29_39550 [Crotalaria pallida]|uniref:Uncharacterized protein n=1 Tax=Crotalaria pallida TaxID=3830 RepID=A0AAN9HPQ1_CROPI
MARRALIKPWNLLFHVLKSFSKSPYGNDVVSWFLLLLLQNRFLLHVVLLHVLLPSLGSGAGEDPKTNLIAKGGLIGLAAATEGSNRIDLRGRDLRNEPYLYFPGLRTDNCDARNASERSKSVKLIKARHGVASPCYMVDGGRLERGWLEDDQRRCEVMEQWFSYGVYLVESFDYEVRK